MKVVGMIPARLESTRLKDKALADIMGMPMVIHTCKRAQLAKKLDEVYLATDNDVIREVAESYNINVIMTSKKHNTGSDRLAEACRHIECDIVVNVQGDEPLVNPNHIDAIIAPMLEEKDLMISIGVTPYEKENSSSDIKAVLDLNNNVMYCSRSDIPYDMRNTKHGFLKMVFIVPFRKEFLLQYTRLKQTPLELVESNEYLRIIENGLKIRAVHVGDAKISVDTQEDLEVVRNLMLYDKIRSYYA